MAIFAMAFIQNARGINVDYYDTDIANACNVNTLGTDRGNALNYFVAVYQFAEYTCNPGQYLDVDADITVIECKQCPNDYYCPGGKYTIETAVNSKINCPLGTVSPSGAADSGACGRKLHFGDYFIYVRSQKKTTPSLNIDVNGDGIPDYFGNLTSDETVMNKDFDRKIKVKYDDQVMYLYDDTVATSK